MVKFQLLNLKKKVNYWRINHNIQARELRVIDEKDKQIGIMTLSDGLKRAEKTGLDLVEIAPKAKPPVAKIVDFGKFKYQEGKKAKKEKKHSKAAELKEIRFSPFIGEADYKTRTKKIDKFLSEMHKVRVVVKFKGRQMGSKQQGYNLLGRLIKEFGDRIQVDMEPKFLGRHLVMVISPLSKGKIRKQNNAKTKDKKINNKKVSNNKKG